MSAYTQEMEALQRRMRELQELEAQQAIDPGGSGDKHSDEEIEILEEVAHKPNYHGLDKQWHPLQESLIPFVKKKYPNIQTKVQAEENAALHVKAWIVLNYDSNKILEMVRKAEDRVKKGKQDKAELNKFYWDLLTKQKQLGKISPLISASFLVDKTVEHFKKVLAAEAMSPTYIASTPPPRISTPTRPISRSDSITSPEPSSRGFPPPPSQRPREESDELETFLTGKLHNLLRDEASATNCSCLILNAISESVLSAKDLLQMFTVDLRMYGSSINLTKVIAYSLRQVNTNSICRHLQLEKVVNLLVEFCQDFNERFPDYKKMITSNHPANTKFTDILRLAEPPRKPPSPPRRSTSQSSRPPSPPRRPPVPESPLRRSISQSSRRSPSPPRGRPASPPRGRPASPPRSYRSQESHSPARKYRSRPMTPPMKEEYYSPSSHRSSSKRSPRAAPSYSPHSAPREPPHYPEVEGRASSSRYSNTPDFSNFKASTKSIDPNLHRMKGHPLKKEQEMDPQHITDYTLVAIDGVVVGAGLKNNELVQIGAAFSGGSSTFFAPVSPSSSQDEATLEELGFKKSGSCFNFRHPTDRKKINCLSIKRAFEELCSFLRTAKGRMDGVLLMFLHRETLLAFLKTVGKLPDNIKQQVTLTVKGYIVLEPLIRTNILTNVESRINIQDVGKLFDIRTPSESSADLSAEILIKTAFRPEVQKYLGNHMKKLRTVQVEEVSNVLDKLIKVDSLNSYIAVELAKNKHLSLKGVFDPFPQDYEPPDIPELISNKFVELLVLNELSMEKLKEHEHRYGSNELFDWLKNVIFESIGDQREKTVNIVKDCLAATVHWSRVSNEHPQQETTNSRQRNDSGLSTPTYDSESSMPEELPNAKSPFKSREYSLLEEYLIAELSNINKGKFTQDAIKSVAWQMAKAWENMGYNWLMLSQRCTDPEVTIDSFEVDMMRKFRGKYMDKPKEWKGFSLGDLFEKTYNYFKKATSYKDKEFKALEKHYVEAISNRRGHGIDVVASPEVVNTAKALTKTWEAISYSYKTLLMKITHGKQSLLAEAQLKNALAKKFPLPPESWGGFDYDFIVQETFTYFKKEADKEASDDSRKRKLAESSAPPMDMRKRMRLEQEERWKKEIVGIEDEMDGLLAFCDKIKKDSWEFSQSKEIIIQMIKLLERNQYTLRGIRDKLKTRDDYGKDLEMVQISRKVFGDDKKKQTKKGAYVGQSDMTIYGELLKRFSSYISNPELVKDDIAFKPVEDPAAQQEPVYIESMETIDAIIVELQKRYERHARGIPRDYEVLFRFLYYNAPIKTVQASVPVYKMVRDLVVHLNSKIRFKDLAMEIEKLRDSKVPAKELNEKLGQIVKRDKLPSNCTSKAGLLLNSVAEFFYRNKESFPFSPEAKSVKMTVDKTLPENYQKHIFYCFVEEALQMSASGELEGFDVRFIDTKNLSQAVRDTVIFMIECGFNLYEAISNYIDGNLIEVLKKLIKPHEEVNPEANHSILLTRLTHDFIDSTIKKEPPTLPVPKTHRNLLKRRVVNLISNGQFLRTEALDKVRINLAVPKLERETLEPISETGNNNDELKDEAEQKTENDIIPGSVVLSKVIVIPPLKKKNFFASVHGLPKIKKESRVRIKPVKESVDSHKVEMTAQITEVHMDMTVLVSVQNKSETEVVQLPKGLVIANAEVMDKSAVLEEGLTPGYCLQFIRHFNRYQDNQNIRDIGDLISFGAENNVTTLTRNQRTNFRIFGTKYVSGKQDYYTVDAVVEFLLRVKQVVGDYQTYLRIAIQKGTQIVRLKDAEDLHAYLHGKTGICSQIDKSFSNEKDKELTEELEELKKIDGDLLLLPNVQAELNETHNQVEQPGEEDSKSGVNKDQENNNPEEDPNKKLILQLKEFLMTNYMMKLPQIKEELSFFVELLEECGHPLSLLRLNVFALPYYREVLKDELKVKLNSKLKERGFLVGEFGDFNHLNKISMDSIVSLPKPTKIKDLHSFLSFANKFTSEVPSLADQTAELGSFIQSQALEGDFGWTASTDKLFEDIRLKLGSVTSLRPPTEEGRIDFFSAASAESIAAVIVQEQNGPSDEKAWYPIAYNSRLLTPEEEEMAKIEKEGHAVIWGIKFNKDTLFGVDFNLNVSSDQLGRMFSPGNVNTEHWFKQLNDFKFSVKLIKACENPAVCLTTRDENEDQRPYARETLVECLLDETLSLMKKNGKTRNRWIKFQNKRRKRAYAETIEKNVGMAESGNFDFEYQPKVAKLSGGPGAPGRSGSSKATGSVQLSSTIDFIIASSDNRSEPQDIASDAAGPRHKLLPQCIMPSYQPLFELNYSYLVGVKHMDEKVAKDKADKTFTKLVCSNVEYEELKQFVAEYVKDNVDVQQNDVSGALNNFIRGKGVERLFMKEEFLKQCVEHFYLILKIRPRIKVKLKEKKPPCKESQIIYDAEDIEEETGTTGGEETKETESEESGWFLDLLEDDVGHGQRVNWSTGSHKYPSVKPQKSPQLRKESREHLKEYNASEDNLKGFYEKTIESLKQREQKKFDWDGVTANKFIECWVIAQVDCKKLHFIYQSTISNGRSAVIGKLQSILSPYDKILPIKGSYLTNLVTWTYKYFKSITNSGGSLHSLQQRNQLMRIQKEGGNEGLLWSQLGDFYVSVMLYAHDKKLEEATQTATDCIDWFQLCGFSYHQLREIFTAAACISSCLDQLYDGLMHIFNSVSCLLPKTVDIERLIKYCLVFFRAEAVFKDFVSTDPGSSAERLTTLFPLVTHANQVILADMDSQKDVSMGHIVIKDELLIQPGERESKECRISWTGRPPSPGTPLRMVTHPFTKVAHKTVEVVERTWHYTGMDVDITVSNTSKSNAVRIGNPGRELSVAEILLGPPTPKLVSDQCEVSAEILARHGIDLNTLAKMYKILVSGTEGCPTAVMKIALQQCFKSLYQQTDLNPGQKFLFDSFIKEALKYSSRVNVVEVADEEAKEKGKESEMAAQDVDIEDGEVLSDDEDDKDVKVRDRKADKKEEEKQEEEPVSAMISFAETTFSEEQLNQDTKEVEAVDLVALLRQNYSEVDLSPVCGYISVGKYLVPEKQVVEVGEASYNIHTVVTFLNNSMQHHGDYVKKVLADHPDQPLVKMDHRKLLLSTFGKDIPEDCPEIKVELEVLTKMVQIQRLTVRFKELFKRQTEMPVVPTAKEIQFQPLFEKYFNDIFYCGLSCQANWYEVARVASEELVHCWVAAQFQYSHLVRNMGVVMKEANPRTKKEKYKHVYRYFQKELQHHEEKLPPALHISLFVKKTIEMIETIERVNKLNKIELDKACEHIESDGRVDVEGPSPEPRERSATPQSPEGSIVLSSDGEEDDGELLKSLKDLNEKTDLKNLGEMEALEMQREALRRQLTEEEDEGELGETEEEENMVSSSTLNLAQLDMLTKYVSQCSKEATKNQDSDEEMDDDKANSDVDKSTNDQDEPMDSVATLDLEDSSVQLMSSIRDEIRKEKEEESGRASEEEVEDIPQDDEEEAEDIPQDEEEEVGDIPHDEEEEAEDIPQDKDEEVGDIPQDDE